MTMVTANKKYDSLFVTFNRYMKDGDDEFLAQQQYKWVQKKLVPVSTTCGCKKAYYKYLIRESAHGRKLSKAIWVDDLFVYEEEELRPEITMDVWHERRGDAYTKEALDELHPHERPKSYGPTDASGHHIVNPGYISWPSTN